MTLTICDGCWLEGDSPHTCEQNRTVLASDGLWCVPCVCRVDPTCRGNQNGVHERVRVEVVS